jgi:uncharacterized protein DUF4158
MTPLSFSRGQMVREATLTEADLAQVARCRRDHNRLGLAYQIGFVRLFHRFPAQHPLEICDELLSFVALQLGLDEARIADYAPWQHTASEHQDRIREYLALTDYGPQQAVALERFVFEESCRLEQTAALLARAREFLKEPCSRPQQCCKTVPDPRLCHLQITAPAKVRARMVAPARSPCEAVRGPRSWRG